jgi:hypothetical protein
VLAVANKQSADRTFTSVFANAVSAQISFTHILYLPVSKYLTADKPVSGSVNIRTCH